MKIMIINGGPRKKGRTGIAVRNIMRLHGIDQVDLSGDDALPLFNGEKEQDLIHCIRLFREKIKEADAVVVVSPEYHSGMSGLLKNALDFLGSEHLQHKPVALLAIAGGGKGGINALNNMRTVMRGLYANSIPRQLVLDPSSFNYDNDSLTPDAEKLINGLIEELKMYTKSYLVMKEGQR